MRLKPTQHQQSGKPRHRQPGYRGDVSFSVAAGFHDSRGHCAGDAQGIRTATFIATIGSQACSLLCRSGPYQIPRLPEGYETTRERHHLPEIIEAANDYVHARGDLHHEQHSCCRVIDDQGPLSA
jgi:hypothetical protein